jgi:hypothetical protein
MNMKVYIDNFADRLISEQAELAGKRAELQDFMRSEEFKQLSAQQQCMLRMQSKVLKHYSEVLDCRIHTGSLEFVSFSVAIEAMKQGYPVSRISWNNKQFMVIKQVPAMIGKTIIPNMTSLPQQAKDIILDTAECITYADQCILFDVDSGRADSWSPTISDIFAQDWAVIF